MTDYSPAALQEKVKKIGHKAIETYLYMLETTGWDGDAEGGFYGAGWDGQLPPVTGPTGTVKLRCVTGGFSAIAAIPPGFNHIGEVDDGAGQYYQEYEVDAWASIYEPWMTRIEDAFKGWDDLPEPGGFDTPISSMQKAVTELTPLPTESASGNQDGGSSANYTSVDLETALDTIKTFVGEQSGPDQGLLTYTFYQNYGPVRTRSIMANQGQIAIVLGLALLGEKKVWEGAQLDIMAIADAAEASMRPGGAGGGDTIDLNIVKAFVDLAKGFLPAPVQLGIDTAEGAIDLVGQLMPQKPEGPDSVELTGYTVDEVASSMEEHIRTLDKKVFDSEYELKYTTLEGVLDYIWGHAASQFHIDPDAGIQPDLKNAQKIDTHPESLKKVGYELVPQVAAYMGRAAEDAQSANQAGIWSRSRVGLLASGPYDKWVEVLNQFDKVTTGSAAELVEAGKLLAIGAGWLQDTDGDSRAALAGVDDDLARGEYSWDNSKPPPPPTYYTLPNGKRIPI